MRKISFTLVAMALVPCLFAVDGVVLINQSTVTAGGGFPYVISQPGSYKLSGNLTVSTSVDAIQIKASNVTLDLNGFTITGPGVTIANGHLYCGGVVDGNCFGINAGFQNVSNTTVANGTIQQFSQGALFYGTSLVREVRFIGNFRGLYSVGVIVRCAASGNLDYGMFVYNATVTDSSFISNPGDGIVTNNSTVTRSVMFGNFNGLRLQDGSLAGENTIIGNTHSDIYQAGGKSLGNNVCSNNTLC